MKKIAISLITTTLLTAATQSLAQDVTIGAVLPLTGASASIGEDQRRGAELAVEHVNAAGGVLGRKLRVIIEDSGSRVPTALDAAKKLATIDKVPVVMGEYSSGVTIPIGQYLLQEGVSHFNIGSSSPRIRHLGMGGFTLVGLDDIAAKFAAEDVHAQNFRKAALIVPNNPYGQDLVPEFTKAFEALGGQVVAQLLYTGGQSTYRRELQQVARAAPDVIVYSAYGQEAAIINREAFNLGMNTSATWYGIYQTMCTSDTPAEIANGQIGMELAASVGNRGRAYEDAYLKKYNETVRSTFGSYVYDGVRLAATAIQQAGSTDPAKVRAVLGQAGYTYNGITGEIVFDQDGQRAVPAYQRTRYQNGVIAR